MQQPAAVDYVVGSMTPKPELSHTPDMTKSISKAGLQALKNKTLIEARKNRPPRLAAHRAQ